MTNQCFNCSKHAKPNDYVIDNNPTNVPVVKQIKGNYENSQCVENDAYISSFVCDECYTTLDNQGRIQMSNGFYYVNTNRPTPP